MGANDAFNLIGKINITGDAQKDLVNINKQLDATKKKMDETEESTSRTQAGQAALGAGMMAAGGLIVGALQKCTTSAEDYGSQIVTVQRLTGLNAEQSSEATAVMTRYGVEGKSLGTVMKALSTQILATGQSSKPATTALGQMGIEVKNANGTYKDQMTILSEVAEWYKKSGGGAEANALAAKALGKGYQALLPVLANGAAGIEEVTAAAKKNGQILSQDQLDAVKASGKATADLNDAVTGLTTSIGIILIPLETLVTNVLVKLVQLLDATPGPIKVVMVVGAGLTGVLLLIVGAIITLGALMPSFTAGLGIVSAAFGTEAGAATAAWVATIWPIALVIAAIAAVAFAVYEIIQHWKQITDFFAKLWKKIISGVAAFNKDIHDFFVGMWNGAVKGAKDGIDNIINFIKSLPSRAVAALKDLGSMILKSIQPAIDALNRLNPFAKHSPSLVENVLAGVDKIGKAYSSLGNIDLASPQIGGISAGAGSSYVGGTNNYNLTINSSANTEPMANDFAMLKALNRGN